MNNGRRIRTRKKDRTHVCRHNAVRHLQRILRKARRKSEAETGISIRRTLTRPITLPVPVSLPTLAHRTRPPPNRLFVFFGIFFVFSIVFAISQKTRLHSFFTFAIQRKRWTCPLFTSGHLFLSSYERITSELCRNFCSLHQSAALLLHCDHHLLLHHQHPV